MPRVETPAFLKCLLLAARTLADESNISAVILVSDIAYDFKDVQERLAPQRLIVSSHLPDVQQAAQEDGVPLVPLLHEPQTRQVQVSQAVLEAIADDLLQTGERVAVLYSGFERDNIDTLSVISLSEHLAKLTSRDLQRLETQVPLPTLRRVVDLAVEIGRDGRE